MYIRFTSLALTLLLAACAGKGPTQSGDRLPDQLTIDASLIDATPLQLLESAESDVAAKKYQLAEAKLNRIVFDLLTPELQIRYAIIFAETSLNSGHTQEALEWLAGDKVSLFDRATETQQIKISQLRATAWEYAGEFLAAARERIFVAPILPDDQQDLNQELIWADLQFVQPEVLKRLSELDKDSELSGWAGLAYASITTDRRLENQVLAIRRWQAAHPRHPAALRLPGGLDMLAKLVEEQPQHLGLLLPLSGPLADSANAVLKGFMAAYFDARSFGLDVPEVTIADIADHRSVSVAYDFLVGQGAELIIGPLTKTSIEELSRPGTLTRPLLALNTVDQQKKFDQDFYQFGLNPEDEAQQVARFAFHRGYNKAAVMTPENSWGNRITRSFESEFQKLGGHIVAQSRYDNRVNRDLLQYVRELLALDESLERTATVEQILGTNVNFEARRRKDIDFIFLAALPSEARQLKPLFDFQYAMNVPIIGVSALYSGVDAPDLDKDIEGVIFPDMPWQISDVPIKQELLSLYREQNLSRYNRLLALGADAFQLYPRLRQLEVRPESRVHGYTGILSLDENRRIVRELSWAGIYRGVAVPVWQLPENE